MTKRKPNVFQTLPEALPEFTWDIQHQGAREVFCAALGGVIASPHFSSTEGYVGNPEAAVEYANQVVEAMQRRGKVKI